MLTLLIGSVSNAVGFLASTGVTTDCWNVDKSVVMHGGCVTIIVNKPCNESWHLALQIDNRNPVRLLEGVGPDYSGRNSRLPGREATLVLLYYDLINPEGLEEIPGQPGRFRLVPVFNRPGIVHLTLYDGEQSLGTRKVTVLPCAPEARAALGLLSPSLPGRKGSPRDEFPWLSLIVGHAPNLTSLVTDEELQLLRDQLPIMMRHPDWAEIAEMRLAKLEAAVEYRKASNLVERKMHEEAKTMAERPLPDILIRALEKEVRSPFAQALQDDARDLAGSRNVLIPQRDLRQGNE